MEAVHGEHEKMKCRVRFRILTLVTLFVQQAWAQPSGEEILGKVQESFSAVQDYAATLDVSVDMERLRVPAMKVTLYFKQPDKVHFESEGFAMLPREGVAFNPARFLSRYTVEGVSTEDPAGHQLYRLVLSPKDNRSAARRLFLFVNPRGWIVERLQTPMVDGRTMTASFSYQDVSGFSFPGEVVVEFTAQAADTGSTATDLPVPLSRPQIPRTGTITIKYSDVRVNTGLSDDIFERRPTPQKE